MYCFNLLGGDQDAIFVMSILVDPIAINASPYSVDCPSTLDGTDDPCDLIRTTKRLPSRLEEVATPIDPARERVCVSVI